MMLSALTRKNTQLRQVRSSITTTLVYLKKKPMFTWYQTKAPSVSCSSVTNNLRQIYLSDYEEELAVKQPAIATVDMAKGFLQRYQNFAGDSFYGELASTLDN